MKHLRKFLMHAAFFTMTSILCGEVAQAQPMYAYDTVSPFQARYSPSGQYRLILYCGFYCGLHHDYWNGSAWITLRAILGGGAVPYNPYVIMQGDGNLVEYDDLGPQDETNTDGNPDAWLNIQDDGNIVIYDASNQPIWSAW